MLAVSALLLSLPLAAERQRMLWLCVCVVAMGFASKLPLNFKSQSNKQ